MTFTKGKSGNPQGSGAEGRWLLDSLRNTFKTNWAGIQDYVTDICKTNPKEAAKLLIQVLPKSQDIKLDATVKGMNLAQYLDQIEDEGTKTT